MTTADHGTARRYWCGCRCDECRRANTEYEKARNARRMDPEPLIRWERTSDLKWQTDAACREHPTAWWFANNGRKPYSRTNLRALAVCATCPVRAECLDYALEIPPPWHGIFGGHNVAERVEIYKERHNRRP